MQEDRFFPKKTVMYGLLHVKLRSLRLGHIPVKLTHMQQTGKD